MQHIYQIFLEDLKRPFNKGKREEAKSRHGLKLLQGKKTWGGKLKESILLRGIS